MTPTPPGRLRQLIRPGRATLWGARTDPQQVGSPAWHATQAHLDLIAQRHHWARNQQR